MFNAESYDKGLVITLIKEANIVLASLDENSEEYQYNYWRFKECIDIMRAIERTEPQQDKDINFILDTINTIWRKGVLSPLTLKDDEFEISKINGVRRNIRYCHIIKINDNIYNENAYKITIRKTYDNVLQEELKRKCIVNISNPRLYISKGGIITGEYIEDCIIRKEIVDKHSFTIQSIVNIPASAIELEDCIIYIVDHREPKLKILKEFYDVITYFDNTIKDMKLNIRKYKKL